VRFVVKEGGEAVKDLLYRVAPGSDDHVGYDCEE
jgi:hypothetical protein